MEGQFTNENTWVNAQLFAHRKHGQLSLLGCIPQWVGRPGEKLKDQPFLLGTEVSFKENALMRKLHIIFGLFFKETLPSRSRAISFSLLPVLV